MAQPKGGDRGDSSGGGDSGNRRGARRRRSVLNTGMPFVQLDDFVNQSEDAVALGYRVLEETIEEIKKGYQEAKDFNEKHREFERKQRAFERGEGPAPVAPAIPWEQLVDRAQSFQEIALEAVRDGTEIFFDSIRSSTKSTKRLARTWEKSREDVDARPVLAGPIFEDPVELTEQAGQQPERVVLSIRHKGLTRLRIDAIVDPKPVEIQRPRRKQSRPTETSRIEEEKPETFGSDVEVRFEPATDMETYDEATSLLKVTVGPIPINQRPGLYEGFIRASNFELLIARLRIRVLKASQDATMRTAWVEANAEQSKQKEHW